MPRYRFSWSNLPEGVVSALARFLDLDGPRHEIEASLRTEFGARPTPAFVKGTWECLRDEWLRQDPSSLSLVASELRDSDVGDTTIDDDFSYICSCRNAKSLREVVLAAFIDLGEVSEDAPSLEHESGAGPILRGRSRIGKDSGGATGERRQHRAGEFAGSDKIGSGGNAANVGADGRDQRIGDSTPGRELSARRPGQLRSWLRDELRIALGDDALDAEDDGSFTLTNGSSVVSVSVLSRPPRIEMMSQLVSEVDSSQELLSSLNRINGLLHFGKIHLHETDRAVRLTSQFLAAGLGGEDLRTALASFVNEADHFDTEIAAMFGGRLARLDNLDDEQLT